MGENHNTPLATVNRFITQFILEGKEHISACSWRLGPSEAVFKMFNGLCKGIQLRILPKPNFKEGYLAFSSLTISTETMQGSVPCMMQNHSCRKMGFDFYNGQFSHRTRNILYEPGPYRNHCVENGCIPLLMASCLNFCIQRKTNSPVEELFNSMLEKMKALKYANMVSINY